MDSRVRASLCSVYACTAVLADGMAGRDSRSKKTKLCSRQIRLIGMKLWTMV